MNVHMLHKHLVRKIEKFVQSVTTTMKQQQQNSFCESFYFHLPLIFLLFHNNKATHTHTQVVKQMYPMTPV